MNQWIACSEACSTCYGGNDNECLSCPNQKVLESGSCLSNCSNGNYPDQNNFCQGFFILDFISVTFIYFIWFFQKKTKKYLGCQSPCSTCVGLENGKCLNCISPLVQNGTFCISESECTQNGFVDSNRNCQSIFLSFSLSYS